MNIKEFLMKYGLIIVVGLMMLSFFVPLTIMVGSSTTEISTWLWGMRINQSTGQTTIFETFFESTRDYDIISGTTYVIFFIIASGLLTASCFIRDRNEKLWKIFGFGGICCMAFVFVGFSRMSLETIGNDFGYFVLNLSTMTGQVPHAMFYIALAALVFGGVILKLNLEEMK